MRVIIADDHDIIRFGIRIVLEKLSGISAIDEFRNGRELMDYLDKKPQPVDIIILDINMPEAGGIEILNYLQQKKIKARTLVISQFSDPKTLNAVFQNGANGYINKQDLLGELEEALQKIRQGKRYIHPDLSSALIGNAHEENTAAYKSLSAREYQVFIMLAKGYSTNKISMNLHLKKTTVSTFNKRLLKKLGLSRTQEIPLYAYKHGLIQ